MSDPPNSNQVGGAQRALQSARQKTRLHEIQANDCSVHNSILAPDKEEIYSTVCILSWKGAFPELIIWFISHSGVLLVRRWSLGSRQPVLISGTRGSILSSCPKILQSSPDGSYLATRTAIIDARVASDKFGVFALDLHENLRYAAFNMDETLFACVYEDGFTLCVFNISRGPEIAHRASFTFDERVSSFIVFSKHNPALLAIDKYVMTLEYCRLAVQLHLDKSIDGFSECGLYCYDRDPTNPNVYRLPDALIPMSLPPMRIKYLTLSNKYIYPPYFIQLRQSKGFVYLDHRLFPENGMGRSRRIWVLPRTLPSHLTLIWPEDDLESMKLLAILEAVPMLLDTEIMKGELMRGDEWFDHLLPPAQPLLAHSNNARTREYCTATAAPAPPSAKHSCSPAPSNPYDLEAAPDRYVYTTFQAADLAFSHACSREADIHQALRNLGWEGTYIIQAGFNEEMLDEGYVTEEIHVFLDSKFSVPETRVISEFSTIFSLFFGFIHTPGDSYTIPCGSSHLQTWHIRQSKNSLKSISAAAFSSTNGDSCSYSGGSKDVSNSGGSSSEGPNTRKSEGGEDEGDEDGSDAGARRNRDGGRGPNAEYKGGKNERRSITVPFESKLYDKDRGEKAAFTISSKVDIKIEENLGQDEPPPDSYWPGPWIGVNIDRLGATASGIYLNGSTYSLGWSQVQIAAVSDNGLTVVHDSPPITHGGEDIIRHREDRNVTGSIRAAVGLSDSGIQVTGTSGCMLSAEQVQGRWEIMTHPVDSLGGREVGRMWKYAHNDAYFQRVTGHSFSTMPSITLGVGCAHDEKPKIDVAVAMHWSLASHKPNRMSRLLNSLLKSSKGPGSVLPPAFINFAHHASISIDLQQFDKEEKGWVNVADAKDVLCPVSPGQTSPVQFDYPHKTIKISTKNGLSDCEVLLKRAIRGEVSLSCMEDGVGPRLLLPSTSSHTGSAAPSTLLPTPSPSPTIPSLSAKNMDCEETEHINHK